MAWIELHQTRQRHPKTLRLAALIGEERRYACGLLDDLWCWALDVADRDGCLLAMTADDIAVALDYPRKKGKWLLTALVGAGWVDEIDGAYYLHDWAEYAGRLNDRREKDAVRKRKVRNVSAGCPQDVREKSRATVPNSTKEEEGEDTCVREGDPPADLLTHCQANFPAMNAAAFDELRGFLADGISPDMVCLAVDEARAHGSIAWSYARSIMDNWVMAGIKTTEAAKARIAQHRARGKPVPGRSPNSPADRPPDSGLRWVE